MIVLSDFTVYLPNTSALLVRTELPTVRESVITLIPQNCFENRYCDDNPVFLTKPFAFLEKGQVCVRSAIPQ